MAISLTYFLAGVAVTYGFFRLLIHFTQDANEPPVVDTGLPFVGPMVGLSKKKTKYYVELRPQIEHQARNKTRLPIYTLRMPGSRIYLVTSASLIPAVQRQFRTLAFPPLEAKAAMAVTGTSKTANDILQTNVNGEEGEWGLSITFYKAIHPPLSPAGEGLDAMNRAAIKRVAELLRDLSKQLNGSTGLFNLIRHQITTATTDAVYGPENPFKDTRIETGFWKFEPGIIFLLMGMSMFAKESVNAREMTAEAFRRYFENGGHDQGSALIKARYEHSREYKLPVNDIARFEVGGAVAILSNTAPATFWMIFHVYSDLEILKACREELSKVIDEATGADGKVIRTIDISNVKSACPILLSTFQEVLRFHTIGVSARLVMEDHLLDGKYLLKKGATVMVPGPVQHTDTSVWGSDVGDFNYKRFLKSSRRTNPVAFRAFGGGTTLCPGRHFASTEILAYTAMLIMRFDVEPVSGKWIQPTTDKAGLWATTPCPDEDIDVKISLRDGQDVDQEWSFSLSDSDKAMALAAEDHQAEE